MQTENAILVMDRLNGVIRLLLALQTRLSSPKLNADDSMRAFGDVMTAEADLRLLAQCQDCGAAPEIADALHELGEAKVLIQTAQAIPVFQSARGPAGAAATLASVVQDGLRSGGA